MSGYLPLKDDFWRELISPGGYQSIHAVSNMALPQLLTFISQPQSKTVDEYSLATFSCEVTGGVAPYTYQWKKNGVNVGTNSAALSFTVAAADKNASITVVVTDSVGTVITSSAAVLGVTSYAYQFDGISQYLSTSSSYSIIYTDSFVFELKAIFSPSGFYLNAVKSSDVSRILITSGKQVFINQTSVISISQPLFNRLTDQTFRTLKISRVGNVYTVDVDGVSEQNTASIFDAINIDSLFAKLNAVSSVPYFAGEVISSSITKNGSNIFNVYLNKSLGANQVGGTIINYNPAGWVAV